MSNFMYFTVIGALGGTVELPATRGPASVDHLLSFSRQRFATDPIGTHTLTLINVVASSHIWIGTQVGSTTIWNEEWGGQDYTYQQASQTYDEAGLNYDSQYDSAIVLPVYSAGSALNDWRIRIRKATEAPYYQPYETLMTATVGSSSIYINQLPD